MKKWQIPLVGFAVLCAVVLIQFKLSLLPLLLALLTAGAVLVGFLLTPDKDVYTVWVTTYSWHEGEEDQIDVDLGHEPLAIRAHLTHLWLLFLPAIPATGYLTLAAAHVAIDFDIDEEIGWVYVSARVLIPLVWVILASWLRERWLLQRAEAAEVRGGNFDRRAASYYFLVGSEYFGGFNYRWRSYKADPTLDDVVFYRRSRPSVSRMATAFLFHTFEVVGRGVQDVEQARQRAARHTKELSAES